MPPQDNQDPLNPQPPVNPVTDAAPLQEQVVPAQPIVVPEPIVADPQPAVLPPQFAAPQPSPDQIPATPQPPQTFQPSSMPQPKKKLKLILIIASIFAIVLVVGLVLLFTVFLSSKKAASTAAEKYISSILGGDFSTFNEVTENKLELSEDNFKETSEAAKELIKGDPKQVSVDAAKVNGKERAVVVYKMTATSPADGKETDFHLVLLLEKKDGKWLVVNTTDTEEFPKLTKVKDYSDDDFTSGKYIDAQNTSVDSERQTDIKSMHGQVEAYFAMNGFYPTLAQMNDQAFRQSNMKGLDPETLKDPEGNEAKLVSPPRDNAYSYEPTPAGCSGGSNPCTGYTLTATLGDGSKYTKTALN